MSQENVEIVRGVRIALRPLSERASRRRSLDERLFVRFPAAYRLLADTWMRLPPRSRLRRLMLTRLVRRGNAAVNRRDFALVLVGFDPAIEFRPARALLVPDHGASAYGHDGYLRHAQIWIEAFEDLRLDPEEFLDLGEAILTTIQLGGHGSGSGVATSQQMFQLFRFRRGLVVKQEDFTDRAEALEAVGLSE